MRKLKAFTLIELLIVVAIIAILAAIAVPNFMEAQARAKNTRVKADMKALQTAQEMYRIDNGDYVPDNKPVAGMPASDETDYYAFFLLTTPVAYISQVPPSPYTEKGGVGNRMYFEYWRGGWDDANQKQNIDDNGYGGVLYRFCSWGPDGRPAYGRRGTHTELPDGPFDGGNYPKQITDKTPLFINGLYDATNGTKSAGDLLFSNKAIYNS
jgi:type II secretion system protein G